MEDREFSGMGAVKEKIMIDFDEGYEKEERFSSVSQNEEE